MGNAYILSNIEPDLILPELEEFTSIMLSIDIVNESSIKLEFDFNVIKDKFLSAVKAVITFLGKAKDFIVNFIKKNLIDRIKKRADKAESVAKESEFKWYNNQLTMDKTEDNSEEASTEENDNDNTINVNETSFEDYISRLLEYSNKCMQEMQESMDNIDSLIDELSDSNKDILRQALDLESTNIVREDTNPDDCFILQLNDVEVVNAYSIIVNELSTVAEAVSNSSVNMEQYSTFCKKYFATIKKLSSKLVLQYKKLMCKKEAYTKPEYYHIMSTKVSTSVDQLNNLQTSLSKIETACNKTLKEAESGNLELSEDSYKANTGVLNMVKKLTGKVISTQKKILKYYGICCDRAIDVVFNGKV